MSGYADLSRAAYISPNDLMNSTRVNYYPQELQLHNQLLEQNTQANQQGLDATSTEYFARAAQGLVALGDEAKAAAAYPDAVASLPPSLRGRAPAQFPGMAALQRVAALGTPSEKLGERGLAGQDATGFGQRWGVVGGAPGATAMAPVPPGAYGQGGRGSSITVPPEYMPFYQEASQRTGIPVEVLIAQHRQESGFDPRATGAAGEIGIGQIHPATAAKPGYGMTAVDPAALRDPRTNINFAADYLKARGGAGNWADPEHQRRALAAYNGGGDPNYVANVTRYMPAGYGGAPATQTAAAPGRAAPAAPMRVTTVDPETGLPVLTGGAPVAPVAPAGGGRVQVASIKPTTMTDATPGAVAPPAALPLAEATAKAKATGQPVEVLGGEGGWALPNGGFSRQQPPATTQQPPATTQQPPPVTIPPPPQLLGNGLTREQNAEIPALQEAVRRGQMKAPEADAKLLTYQKENVAAQRQYQLDVQAQQDKQITAARADREEQRKIAEAAQLEQSKGEDADHLRVLQAFGPKVRRGEQLTPEETDQYDLHRRAYAEGPIQVVPDGRGGTMHARVGRDVSDRFPPLPGQKEYAGLKPIPGTEKQPDSAPANAQTAMLDIGAGNRTIVKALDQLEAYPGGVGLLRGSQPNVMSNWTDPEGVKVRGAIGIVQGHIYHELAGTAQSAGEAARLKSFVPGPVDDAEAAKTKLRQMLDNNRETLLDHYRSFGPEAGFRRQRNIEEEILSAIPETAVKYLKENPETVKTFDREYGRGAGKLVLQDG